MEKKNYPVVYQANPLIESRKPFNTLEMRLFLLAVEDVNPHISEKDKYYDKDFRDFFLKPNAVKEIFGHGEYLKRLEKTCVDMAEKAVVVRRSKDNFSAYPIFEVIEYHPRKGLHICFNKHMRPFLLDLYRERKGYTKFNMKQLFNLSSTYAMRILELMLQYKGMMKNKVIVRQFSLEDLRFLLDIKPTEYLRTYDFRRRVLDGPIKEIGEKTLYAITYETQRTGHKVTDFIFYMDCSHVIPDDDAKETITLEKTPNRKDRHGLSEKVVNKLTTLCGSNEEYKKRMDYAVSLLEKRQPENEQAFLYKAVAENYLQQELDRQAEAKKQERAKAAWHAFVDGLDESARNLLFRLIRVGKIAPLTAKSLLEKYGVERCRRNFEAQRKKTDTKNLAGLIIFAIQQDFEGQLAAFEAEHPQKESDDPNCVFIEGEKYYLEPFESPKVVDENDIQPELRKYLKMPRINKEVHNK